MRHRLCTYVILDQIRDVCDTISCRYIFRKQKLTLLHIVLGWYFATTVSTGIAFIIPATSYRIALKSYKSNKIYVFGLLSIQCFKFYRIYYRLAAQHISYGVANESVRTFYAELLNSLMLRF